MHRNAVSPPGDVAPLLVSCDLVVLTLDGSGFRVLTRVRGDSPVGGGPLLPREFLTEGESPESAVTRLARTLGVPDPIRPHQVGVFGEPRRDPARRVLGVGWMILTPEPWEPGENLRWHPLPRVGRPRLGLDHGAVLQAAMEQLSHDIEATQLATELCPHPFTLAQLRAVYEEVWQVRMDAANFHRKFTNLPGVLEPTGQLTRGTRGRPATLYLPGKTWRLPQRVVRPEAALP